MPKQPGMSRCSTSSRSLRWAARKRTRAWATVRRTVLSFILPCPPALPCPPGRPRTSAAARDRRPVPAVRYEHDVARGDLSQHVDPAAGRAVHPLVRKPRGLEVVDLLEL